MDMRPGFFCSSLPGGCGRQPDLYGRGQFCRILAGLMQAGPARSCFIVSIPVYSGPFRSIPVHSILFYSRSSPVQPSPVRSGSVPSVLSSPFPPRRSRPVPSQSSLAQPGPAQLGPVRPVLVCGSGVVVPVGRALCGLTDGEGPRDLTGRVLCGLTFCRENGLSGRGPVGQLCGRVGALAVAVLAGILSLQVRKRRGTLRVPPLTVSESFPGQSRKP